MVEVVIPFAGDCRWRVMALKRVRGLYPWTVTVARGGSPWSKARAAMPAVMNSSADVVVLADADVWTDGVHAAVAEVEAGAAWAIPHGDVHRLTEASTRELVLGQPWEHLKTVERPYLGVEGGGVVVARRETLLDVPLDPRFVGWGQEDESHAMALRAMLGEPWRGTAPLVHLWHPPQPRISRRRGSRDGWELRRRYGRAGASKDTMRALLEEAKDALAALEPPLHDQAA